MRRLCGVLTGCIEFYGEIPEEDIIMYEMIEADNAWDMSQTRMLYEAKVPMMEKKPFRLFIDKRAQSRLEVKVFKDEKGLFAGFAVALIYADIVVIDYFEVADNYKGEGSENEMIEKLKNDILPGARMVFVTSETEAGYSEFYEAAGLKKAEFRLGLGEIKQDVYILPDDIDNVTFEEIAKVYENIYGAMISGAISLA